MQFINVSLCHCGLIEKWQLNILKKNMLGRDFFWRGEKFEGAPKNISMKQIVDVYHIST